MNKYIVLTSLLALAACGGGGGSGGVYSTTPAREPASPAVVAANNNITSLATEILVGNAGASPVVLRSGSVSYNGHDYRSYRLDDVKLNIAGADDSQYVKFDINTTTGEINKIVKATTAPGAKPTNINRMKNSSGSMINDFGGPVFEFVEQNTGKILARVADDGTMTYSQLDKRFHPVDRTTGSRIRGQWNRVDEKVALAAYGNDETLQLQYSDFGKFNPVYLSKHDNITDNSLLAKIRNYEKTGDDQYKLNRVGDLDFYNTADWEDLVAQADGYQYFAGGYAVSGTTLSDTLVPENSTEYNGKAIGRVRKGDTAHEFMTDKAQLVIDSSGNQTLSMKFNSNTSAGSESFYDVTVTNPDNPEFTFGAHAGVDSAYLRDADTPGVTADTPINVQQNWNSGFYGIDNPVEAAGTVHYSETVSGTESGTPFENRVWEFQGAYGAKIHNE